MIRTLSIVLATALCGYILVALLLFSDKEQAVPCQGVEIVVRDSLDKHFVNEADLAFILRKAGINPQKSTLGEINTERIEEVLRQNDMIARVEAYKTPSDKLKLEVEQKMPVLRVMSARGAYYIDNKGSTMALSRRYVAQVPIASGAVEKEFAMTDLYKFALFLQEDDFWNSQIEQIFVHPDGDVELIPRVGNHRIMLGSLAGFEEKLERLRLFYEQAIPKVGWEKYSIINLKYKNQIVCTKR